MNIHSPSIYDSEAKRFSSHPPIRSYHFHILRHFHTCSNMYICFQICSLCFSCQVGISCLPLGPPGRQWNGGCFGVSGLRRDGAGREQRIQCPGPLWTKTIYFQRFFRSTSKNCFLSFASQKNKSFGQPVNFFLPYSLNITFYFKCYLNCRVNRNWNNTQLYIALQNHCIMFPALYSNLKIFVFFHFCARLAFKNGKKSGSVMYTSE